MAKLHFYYSAMNAGKTTTLLQSEYNYRERGMETLLFTPAIDTRRAMGVIASRIGLESKAYPFETTFNFFHFVNEFIKTKHISCILIDEAQFLSKSQVLELTRIVDELKIPTLTYGLRSDFTGEPFEGSLYLLAWADELSEIKTICHCGKKATMNPRIDENGAIVRQGEQIEIGGNDRYISLCRKHFASGETSAPKQIYKPATQKTS
ncbi:MAG TPA: thymidine kinase [Alphaproteobacteria bacterium]|nr:thymidine kinase [Alphaproteobacteria bacterium]